MTDQSKQSERIKNIGDEDLPVEQPDEIQEKPVKETQETGTFGNRESKEYKHLQSAYSKSTQEASQLRGTVANLEERLNILSARLDQPVSPIETKPDELNNAAKDFDELKPFVDRIQKIEQQALMEKRRQEQLEIDNVAQTGRTAREVHNQKILAAHSDAFTISDTVDFKGWLAQQPGYVQQVVNTGNADDIISLLSNYKKQMTTKMDEFKQTTTPTSNGTGSVIDTNKEPPKFTPAQIEAMSDAEFIKNEEAINSAMQAGRIY